MKKVLVFIFITLLITSISFAERNENEANKVLEELRERIAKEGNSYTVGKTEALLNEYSKKTGYFEPLNFDELKKENSVDLPMSKDLPESFSWVDEGMQTIPKNQAGCGSCWAFAALGAMEGYILIEDGVETDLSEQNIIDCNSFGYGCDGGNHGVAQDMKDDGVGFETDDPYISGSTNTEYPCTDIARPYKLDEWYYIAGGAATDEQIKNAIYNYGPVPVSVYAGSWMEAYTGGIFNTNEQDPNYPTLTNHAVVLVGWDDNGGNGYWIMRNSWGPYWGENGYMRITYGTSNIGSNAVVYFYESMLNVTAVRTPNGGETFVPGSVVELEWWVGNNDNDNVKLELYKGGSLHSVIAESVSKYSVGDVLLRNGTKSQPKGHGSYMWTIPADLPEGDDYKVKITNLVHTEETDMSDAYFTVSAGGSVVLLEEGFESAGIPAGWTAIDNDNDGFNWEIGEAPSYPAHTGNSSAISASYDQSAGALTPDNYLITPQLNLSGAAVLTFFVAAQDPDWSQEHYEVLVSTSGSNPEDFTDEVLSETLPAGSSDWYEKTVDLSAYEGQSIYVAFVHTDCTDMFYIKIDDVKVEVTGVTPVEYPILVDAIEYPVGTYYNNARNIDYFNGTAHLIWEGDTENGSGLDICYTKTTDRQHFDAVSVISTNGSTDAGRPAIDIDPNGHIYAAWHAPNPGSTTYGIYVRESNDGNDWGDAEVRVNDSPTEDVAFPAISSYDGGVYCIWNAYGGNTIYIDHKTDSGDWGTDYAYTDAAGTPAIPSIAVANDGTAYATWVTGWGTNNGSDVFVMDNEGGSWNEPVQLTPGGGGNYMRSSITVGPDGTPHLVYVHETVESGPSGDSYYYSIAYAKKDGGSWSVSDDYPSGQPGADDYLRSFNPQVGIDETGRIVTIFSPEFSTSDEVYMSYSDDGGDSWELPIQVSDPAAVNDGYPSIPCHIPSGGKLDVVYASEYTKNPTTGAITGPSSILYTVVEYTDIEEEVIPVIAKAHLMQNSPNPFNPTTTIKFDVKETGNVELAVYNILGQKIVTLFNDVAVANNQYSIAWDGKDAQGKQVSSGVYFYKLNGNDFETSKKMLLMK